MSNLPFHPSVLLCLSVQKALLGAVPATLRLVSGRAVGTHIVLTFVFDGALDEDDVESIRMATTEIIADFPSPWTLEETFIRLDYPADSSEYAYQEKLYERKERTSDGQPLR